MSAPGRLRPTVSGGSRPESGTDPRFDAAPWMHCYAVRPICCRNSPTCPQSSDFYWKSVR
ncbi:protein of unknown function [Burkholderia multivorans]